MKIRKALLASLAAAAVSLAACGASQSATETAPTGDTGQQGEPAEAAPKAAHASGEAKHEHQFPPTVTKFHDAMAPLWHADKGEKRTADTCAAVPELRSAALAVEGAGVPKKATADSDGWNADAKALTAAVGQLEASCKEAGRPNFDAKFHSLHEAFHALVKRVGHQH